MLAGAAGIAGCGGGASGQPVSYTTQASSPIVWGAGTPIDFPIYEEAGSTLAPQGITLNYQQLGPDTAMSGFRRGELAFLATDGRDAPDPFTIRGRTQAESVPIARWAVAVAYNLPLRHPLRLDAKTLADIFRGAVMNWNDREIARQNPGVKLPAIPIRVVHRSDPTLLTALVSGYMAAGSKRWKRSVGTGQVVSWPGGTPDPGDSQLVQTIDQTVGAIGYTEAGVAVHNGLQTADLKNDSGAYVGPTVHATTSGAYPGVATAYLLTYHDLCVAGLTPRQAAATQRVLLYLLGPSGQAMVQRLQFAPLPAGERNRAIADVKRFQCGSQPVA